MVLSFVKEAIASAERSDVERIKFSKDTGKDIITDLHIHSRFSRATSKNTTIPLLVKYSRMKGIGLLGTGDISHEKWLSEIRENLKEKDKTGIYYYKDENGEFPFILSGEISLVFTSGGKGRRVHLVYLAPNLETNDAINRYLDTLGRRDYDGRPIFSVSCENFVKKLMEINPQIEIIPAHIWTPWFGVFGSKSGFNSLKEAFGEQEKNIHAIETGMSSDPEMNWKIKELENRAIISFSDSHSYWPWRLGREATIFSLGEGQNLSYDLIITQIRTRTFKSTIETDPGYGIYHWDGHKDCNFSCPPKKTRELGGICPVCKKPLTIGVDNRVEALKESNGIPLNAKPFYKLLPLHELIAFQLNTKITSKKIMPIYEQLIKKFGDEFNILFKVDKNVLATELEKLKLGELANLIVDNRIANIKVQPGYDGVYGKLVSKEAQKSLI
jgi:uncharacterized protein (TIGR00375 family)